MSDQEILTPPTEGEPAVQPLSISDKFIGIIDKAMFGLKALAGE